MFSKLVAVATVSRSTSTLRDRSRQRRLAVVDVTDRADVDVRLGPLELLLGHGSCLPRTS